LKPTRPLAGAAGLLRILKKIEFSYKFILHCLRRRGRNQLKVAEIDLK
jgi:hypothetical protein